MDQLLKLAEFYALQRVIGPYAPFNALGKLKIFLVLFIALFCLIGLSFLLVGYYMWLHSEYQPPEATMIFGFSMMILTLFMIILLMVITNHKEKKKAQTREKVKQDVTDLLYLIDEKLRENNPVKNHPTASVLTSCLCGFMAGERVKRA
jgi:hypothetical protein